MPSKAGLGELPGPCKALLVRLKANVGLQDGVAPTEDHIEKAPHKLRKAAFNAMSSKHAASQEHYKDKTDEYENITDQKMSREFLGFFLVDPK